MEFEPNCLGYAFTKLGITQVEMYIDPVEVKLTDYFSKAGSPQEAQAVLVIYNHPLEGEQLEHIAVFDTFDKQIVWHRSKYGTRESFETLESLRLRFPEPIFDITYVKLNTNN